MKSPIVFIADRADRIRALRRSALAGRPVYYWAAGDGRQPRQRGGGAALHGNPTDPRTFEPLRDSAPIVIVDVHDERFASRVARAATATLPNVPVLIIDRQRRRRAARHGSTRGAVTWIDEGELLAEAIDTLLRRAAARRRLRSLERALRGARRIAFLVQHDPDPDAIASSLALRAALGYTPSTAPIISCGKISRPENRRLVEQLGIKVRHVSEPQLRGFGPLVLVDVQPPYFDAALGEVAGVVDHHPTVKPFTVRHRDVRTAYGASATMALEYLLARGAEAVTVRLATALLYGIITDTKSLSRPVSEEDLEAFAFLFPRADHDALRRIQHPSYTPLALRRFGEALETARVERGLAYVHLGRLPRAQEHIVAQLAEFCLGMAGAKVAVVSGVFGGRLVMSARALTPEWQLGDRLRELFGDDGSAGGHPVMAKAVVPLRAWRGRPPTRDDRAIARQVRKLLLASMRGRRPKKRAPASRRAASPASR
jgi:nanoRNase/pAp phosphatase (c-di-AMP/oligoRNAs hydrolase)